MHNYIKLYILKLPNTQTNLYMGSESRKVTFISFSDYTYFTSRAPNILEMCRPQI